MDDHQLDGLFHKHLAEYTAPDEGAVANWQRMQLRMGPAPDRGRNWLPWALLLLFLLLGSGMFWYQQQQIQRLESTLAAIRSTVPTSQTDLNPALIDQAKPEEATSLSATELASSSEPARPSTYVSQAPPAVRFSQVLQQRMTASTDSQAQATFSYAEDYGVVSKDWTVSPTRDSVIALGKMAYMPLADSLPALKQKKEKVPVKWFTAMGLGAGVQTPWVDLGVGEIQTTLGVQGELFRWGRLGLQIGAFTDPYSYRLDEQRITWITNRYISSFEDNTGVDVGTVAAPEVDSTTYSLAQVEAPGISIPIRLTYQLARQGKTRPYVALGFMPRYRTNLRTLYTQEERLFNATPSTTDDLQNIDTSNGWEWGTYQAAIGLDWRLAPRTSGQLELYSQFRLKSETAYRGTYRVVGLRANFWLHRTK